MSEIQITDNQLFEIIGRSTVEIWSKDKELDAYRISLEKVKSLATEVDALRGAKPALELSNRQLAEKNGELDRALTEARKEREAIRVELTAMTAKADEAMKNVAILNQSVDAAAARLSELNQTYTALQATISQKKSKK